MFIKPKTLRSLVAFALVLSANFQNVAFSKDYGVMCYNYQNVKSGKSNYSPPRANLGDYVQSLAAWQFLPKTCKPIMIDRDRLKLYSGPNVDMIMNGWYFLNKDNEYFSPKIKPIFVSFHINNTECLNKKTINYLKKHQPIGCRDKNTQRLLEKNGVKAYFSGCLTTTLDIDYKVDNKERNDSIIFCDYKFGNCEQADEFLKSMKNYDFSKIEYTTHAYTKNSTHEERFEETKKLLNRYARAKLVVTSRIHCALPCLAMGTPVILIPKVYDHKRFDGIYELLNTIGRDKTGRFKFNVQRDNKGNVVNPTGYLKYADKLKNTVRQALSKT